MKYITTDSHKTTRSNPMANFINIIFGRIGSSEINAEGISKKSHTSVVVMAPINTPTIDDTEDSIALDLISLKFIR
jgi:hypothetical protein